MRTALTLARTIPLVLIVLTLPIARANQLEPITPRDCTTVRRIPDDRLTSPIQINPQRTRVAYLVNSPNLATNQNDVQLYVRDLTENSHAESVPLMTGTEMHDLHWLGDGIHVSALVRYRGSLVVALVDVIVRSQTIIARLKDTDIQEYSIDQSGKKVVFAIDAASSSSVANSTNVDAERGYLIRPILPTRASYHQAHLFIVLKTGAKTWSNPKELGINSPLTHLPIEALPYLISLHLSMSPDGKSMLFSFLESEHIPASWANNPTVQLFNNHAVPLELTALYEVNTHETKLSLPSAFVYRTPVWSSDSSVYFAVTTEPVNEPPTQQGRENHDLPPPHLFRVNRRSGTTVEIMPASSVAPEILTSITSGDVLLRTGPAEIVRVRLEGKVWAKQSGTKIPLPPPRSLSYMPLTGDGEHIVGDYEDAATPPEIYTFAIGQASIRVLSRLNPQFDHLRIAQTRSITWQTSDGYTLQGTLWLPPNYTEGMKYPLVIQTKPDVGDFACDSGGNHDPSFVPQPIADAGMIYLARTWPQNYRLADDAARYPKGYPGGVSEAAFHLDIWDSAIQALATQGMIDPSRVGIIGFSRAGWYTEFILAHSKIRYKAATAADNVLYSTGDYWLHQTAQSVRDGELMYGGPPYGDSLKNWLKFSISFNMDKIHTPLLLEVFGESVPYSPGKSIPDTLAPSFEVLTGMTQLNKPVALYYYPDDVHQPNHPQTRLASLQRNFDWYRFWLQGYERPDHEAASQYLEWRRLRVLESNGANLQHLEISQTAQQ